MTRLTTGTVVVARYEVTEKVASPHSKAEIWHAQDTIFSREVNLYVIDSQVPKGALDRARATAQISVDGIARVIDVIDKGADQRFVVTERPHGVTTAMAISAATFTPRQATAVVGTIATNLIKAAEKGLHHGNITADSVYFKGQTVKICGLVPRNVLGVNLDYSPQELNLRDARGLSALAYFMMTGLMSNYHEQDNSPLPRLTEIVPGVTPELDALTTDVLNGTNTSITTVHEFLEALDAWTPDDLPEVADTHVAPSQESPEEPVPPVPSPPQRLSARSTLSPTTAPLPGSQPLANPAHYSTPTIGGAAAAIAASGGIPEATSPSNASIGSTGTEGIAAAASLPTGTPPRFVPATKERPQFGAYAPTPSPQPEPETVANQTQSSSSKSAFSFNSTTFVLIFFAAIVLFGLFWSLAVLGTPTKPAIVTPTGRPTPVEANGEEKPKPTEEATKKIVLPEVASAKSLDPQGDENEHPELQDRLVDGDSTKFWYSRTYKTPQFSNLKTGIGIEVKLKEKSTVSSVLVSSGSVGGKVEIRATNAKNPTKGKVLASGSLDGETHFKLSEPAKTQTFVLWFTELPQDDAGKNRIVIYEIGAT